MLRDMGNGFAGSDLVWSGVRYGWPTSLYRYLRRALAKQRGEFDRKTFLKADAFISMCTCFHYATVVDIHRKTEKEERCIQCSARLTKRKPAWGPYNYSASHIREPNLMIQIINPSLTCTPETPAGIVSRGIINLYIVTMLEKERISQL